MKTMMLTIGLLIPFAFCFGQTERISEAGIQFDLPNAKWSLKNEQDENNLTIYFYKREPIKDSKGRQIIPNMSFVVETIPDTTNLVIYSMEKRANVSFDVKEVFDYNDKNPKLKHQYSIGYKGVYTDKGGIPHTVYVIHLIHKDKGAQIIFDITSELFPKYENEFLATIGSIKNEPGSKDRRHMTRETIDVKH